MNILLFDIETSPNIGYTWGKWEQNVIAFQQETQLLSFAYKLLGEPNTKCLTRLHYRDKTDKSLCRALHKVMSEADIIVAHNGDSFDIKKANTRFLSHGLKPVCPFKTIDTKKVAKRAFAFNSNSLNDIAKFLGVGQKVKHEGIDLWLECMAGNKAAYTKMAAYNKRDVELLEKVYNKLLPWTKVPLGTMVGCPKCYSPRLQSRGYQRTTTTSYKRYQCSDCGGWSRERLAERALIKPARVSL